MRALVVGAGVSGLSAALALSKEGAEVLVLERSLRFEAVGAGLQLSPNAVKALDYLGAADRLKPTVYAPAAIVVRSASGGATLLRSPLGAEAVSRWGAPYWQAHRADLQSALLEAVRRAASVEVRTGAEVVSVSWADAGRAEVRLADGAALTADMVLGCDGVRSTLRSLVLGPTPARFTGQTAWRGLTPYGATATHPTAGVILGAGRHFVHYPVRGGSLLNFVAVTQSRDWTEESWSADGDVEDFRAAFADWPEPAATIAREISAVKRWALFDRPSSRLWRKGPVGLLGDAAHPMLPFLAQGAAMALEDAVLLGRCVRLERRPEAALARLQRARAGRTAQVQAASRRNAGIFHLPQALSTAAFRGLGLAQALGAPAGRLDWLYGYDPRTAGV